jgi:DNA repair exonuclease SbcCD ATPase subunit
MANNEKSDGIETNDSINKINDSNNNVFNLEVLTKEIVEIKSQLGKVNELAENLQKEFKENKNLKEKNEELLESHSQKSKLKDLQKGLNKKKIKGGKERTEGLAESMDSSFQELESILENEKLKIEDLPDLEPLLEKLDNKYFKGILKKNNVKVTYSTRMFVSAGACLEEEGNRFFIHYRFKTLKSFF